MWIFGAATGGRPILFHASYCGAKTSLNGLAVTNSASVASGTATESQSSCETLAGFLTRLLIFLPFASIRSLGADFAQAGSRLLRFARNDSQGLSLRGAQRRSNLVRESAGRSKTAVVSWS